MNIRRRFITAIVTAAAMMTAHHVSAEFYSVPDIDSDFKSYMDYRCITNTESAQYRLQQDAWTDHDGLRRYDDYYLVAMGTYYSSTVGDCFKVTLDTDATIYVMIGDIKDNRHTDETNRYHQMGNNRGNILEFIVDSQSLDKYAKRMGTVSVIEGLEGNVETIEKVASPFDEPTKE